jgi:hypothetical integral membrane protein (TIGR02206 family)
MAQFSPPHLAALAVWLTLSAGCVLAARRSGPDARWTRWFRWLLATTILAFWAGEYVADAILGIYSMQYTLPLQLTDLISVTAAFALITRRRWAVELLYFWAFTAALQATLTPDLAYDFPSVFYFTYFVYHVGALVAAVFLVWGLGIRPRPWASARTLLATLVWAAVAGTADIITGGNYMYLAYKPSHGSLLSVLGPWPWYIASTVAVAALLLGAVEVVTRALGRAAADREACQAPVHVQPRDSSSGGSALGPSG